MLERQTKLEVKASKVQECETLFKFTFLCLFFSGFLTVKRNKSKWVLVYWCLHVAGAFEPADVLSTFYFMKLHYLKYFVPDIYLQTQNSATRRFLNAVVNVFFGLLDFKQWYPWFHLQVSLQMFTSVRDFIFVVCLMPLLPLVSGLIKILLWLFELLIHL